MAVDAETVSRAERQWLEDWEAGPRRTRWSRMPLQPGDAAPDLRLRDSAGRGVNLGSLWAEGPLVVVFLRHFGCSCTMGRIARLKEELPQLVEAGARVVAICQGEAAEAAGFAERNALGIPLLCDPPRVAYDAFGLLEAAPSQIVFGLPDAFLLHDRETGAALQASRRGTPRVPVDSPWQLAGDAILDQQGRVRFIHRSQYCDDYVEPKVMLAFLRETALGFAPPSR